MKLFNPTILERIRWYRWLFRLPGPVDRLQLGCDRQTLDIMTERHMTKEPWPRVRNDKWIFKPKEEE